ncbi:MAG: PAS domain S-box protein [Bacteroidales bacterium]|nr:PAS domain S-box protein [Bacteroidales bacterium]
MDSVPSDFKLKSKSIVKMTMDGFILIDSSGIIKDVNETFCRMSGYTEEELLGMQISHLDVIENGDTVQSHIRKTIEIEEDRYLTLYRQKNGNVYHVEVSLKYLPELDGMIALFIRDITEQKSLEDEYIRSKIEADENAQNFRKAFEFSGIGMAMISTEKKIIRINKVLCGMWGYEEHELLNKPFLDFTHPDDVNIGIPEIIRCVQGELDHFSCKKRYVQKNGEVIWANLHASIIRTFDNKPLFFVAQVVNITDQVVRQQELLEAKQKTEKNENYLKTLLNSIPDMVWLKDEKGDFLKCNQKFEERMGAKEIEIMGKNDFDFFFT